MPSYFKTINAKLPRAALDGALFWRGIDGAPCRFRCPRTRHRTYKRACIIPHDLLIDQGAVQDFLPPGRMAALARHCGLQPCTNLNFGPSPALSSAPLSPHRLSVASDLHSREDGRHRQLFPHSRKRPHSVAVSGRREVKIRQDNPPPPSDMAMKSSFLR